MLVKPERSTAQGYQGSTFPSTAVSPEFLWCLSLSPALLGNKLCRDDSSRHPHVPGKAQP